MSIEKPSRSYTIEDDHGHGIRHTHAANKLIAKKT